MPNDEESIEVLSLIRFPREREPPAPPQKDDATDEEPLIVPYPVILSVHEGPSANEFPPDPRDPPQLGDAA